MERNVDAKYELVYVGGWGRSGSTLVSGLLNETDAAVSIGEGRFVWERGVLNNELCSCGSPFLRCAFWAEVGAHRGGWSRDEAEHMLSAESRVQSIWNVAASSRRARMTEPEYLETWQSVYDSVWIISGKPHWIVDSTKDAPFRSVLSDLFGERLNAIRIIRDPRAVAYSWTRIKTRPEITERHEIMPILTPSRSGREYAIAHLAHAWLDRRSSGRRVILRYEDLMSQGISALADAVAKLRFDLGCTENRRTVRHEISGNPGRFLTEQPLKIDDAWRYEFPLRSQTAAALWTFPWLLKHGYICRKAAPDA